MGRLRGYGNAIVPQVAQAFIEAYLMAKKEHAEGTTHFWLELTENEAAAITAGMLPASVQEQVEELYRWRETDTVYLKEEQPT